MDLKPASVVATRLAGALVRRMRRYGDRLLAPDVEAQRAAAVRASLPRDGLRGQVIAVTGSSRGVGYALAAAFARCGGRVVINGRNAETVARAVSRIVGDGGEAIAVVADVATAEGATRLLAEVIHAYGRIDVLVNNAAILGPHGTEAWRVTPEAWDEVFKANIYGPFLCSRAVIAWMADNGVTGRIINVSSGAGRMAAPGLAPYVATKFALEGYTRALALDAAGPGIVVCAIELGTLRTSMSRAVTAWEDHIRLPAPETVVPVFLHALTAPAMAVHGRIFAAWRHAQDSDAEGVLCRPLASHRRFSFTPLEHAGRVIRRTDAGVAAYDRAENPLGMPRKVREMLRTHAARLDLSRYPDESYPRLRNALARRFGLPENWFTFAAGSAELVERIVRTFVNAGDEVISNDSSWFMFDRYCAIAEGIARKVPVTRTGRDGAFGHNLEGVARAVTPHTRLIYLVSPANPLGNIIRHGEFEAFLEHVPLHVPVVVDEAYVEFCENPDVLRTHDIVRATDRMVIGLRTFSKFYGLAGLRIGYAYGTERAIGLLGRLEHLFALSSVAEEAALAALEDSEHAAATHELLRAEKTHIASVASRLGLETVPTELHTMLIESPVAEDQVARVWAAFADAGILVPRGLVGGRYLMLPVLHRAQNDRHLDIIASLQEKPGRIARKEAAAT